MPHLVVGGHIIGNVHESVRDSFIPSSKNPPNYTRLIGSIFPIENSVVARQKDAKAAAQVTAETYYR